MHHLAAQRVQDRMVRKDDVGPVGDRDPRDVDPELGQRVELVGQTAQRDDGPRADQLGPT